MSQLAHNLYKCVVGFTHCASTAHAPTPWEVALSLVDQVPPHLFNTEALVPGSGYGVLALALVYRGWNPSKIYCIEIEDKYVIASKLILGRVGINVVQDDFLSWNPLMQFDVSLCNPPYQSNNKARNIKLYPKFVTKVISLVKDGGHIGFVCPNTWVDKTTRQFTSLRDEIIENINLDAVTNVDKFFSVGVSISMWHGVKGEYDGSTVVDGVHHDFRLGPKLSKEQVTSEAIYDKIKSAKLLPLVMHNGLVSRDMCKEQSGNKILFSGKKIAYTMSPVEGAGVPKFVAPFSCSAYSRFYTEEAVGMLNLTMPCSKEEAEEISKIWDLKVVRFLIDTYRKSAGFAAAVKNGVIPDLRGLNDQEAYEALDLTKEEIELVEKHNA